MLLSISPLMVPVVGVGHAPTTAFATEAYTLSPISAPVLGPASGRGLETPPTVSDHVVLTIVIANYWPFSNCLWPPIVRYRPRSPMP